MSDDLTKLYKTAASFDAVSKHVERMQNGPITEMELSNQNHINREAQALLLQIDRLEHLLYGDLHRESQELTSPLRTWLKMVTVPRALMAEPTKPPMLRLRP